MEDELIKIIRHVNSHMELKYNIPLSEMEITETKGYWRIKKKCDPATCGSPIHTFMGNEEGIQHTTTYHDSFRGADGKFKSIYSSWKAMKQATNGGILTDTILGDICKKEPL